MHISIWGSRDPSFEYSYIGDEGLTTLRARPCFFKGSPHILLTSQSGLYEEAFLASCPVAPRDAASWSELFSRSDTRQIDGRTIRHLKLADIYEAQDLAEQIRSAHDWEDAAELLPQFCELAGMREAFERSGERFEYVLFEAADFLSVDLIDEVKL